MTELKRSMAALEEVQSLLACHLSGGGQEGAVDQLRAKMADLDVRVRAIEARYNKSVQNNNSIYGPKTTEKIKIFLEEFRAVQQSMSAHGLAYASAPMPNAMATTSSSTPIQLNAVVNAQVQSSLQSSSNSAEMNQKEEGSVSNDDPNALIGKMVLDREKQLSDLELNQAIQQQEMMTEKIASLPPGMVRDTMSGAMIEIQRCLNRIEKKRAEEMEREKSLRVDQNRRTPRFLEPDRPSFLVPPYPGLTPGLISPTNGGVGGLGPGGHFGGDLVPGGGFGGQGGSLLGPGHPMFTGGDDFGDVNGGGNLGGGIFAGKGRGPPGVPPGARFDPFGPGVPGYSNRGGGRGGRGPPGSGFPGTEPFFD